MLEQMKGGGRERRRALNEFPLSDLSPLHVKELRLQVRFYQSRVEKDPKAASQIRKMIADIYGALRKRKVEKLNGKRRRRKKANKRRKGKRKMIIVGW